MAKTPGIPYLGDPSLYTFSDEDIPLMLLASEAFVKNDHRSALFCSNYFHRYAIAFLDELHFFT